MWFGVISARFVGGDDRFGGFVNTIVGCLLLFARAFAVGLQMCCWCGLVFRFVSFGLVLWYCGWIALICRWVLVVASLLGFVCLAYWLLGLCFMFWVWVS